MLWVSDFNHPNLLLMDHLKIFCTVIYIGLDFVPLTSMDFGSCCQTVEQCVFWYVYRHHKELWDSVSNEAGHWLNGCSQALCTLLERNGKTIYLRTSGFLPICTTAFPDKLLNMLSITLAANIFLSFLLWDIFRMGITLVFNDLAFLQLLSSVSQCYLLSFCLT